MSRIGGGVPPLLLNASILWSLIKFRDKFAPFLRLPDPKLYIKFMVDENACILKKIQHFDARNVKPDEGAFFSLYIFRISTGVTSVPSVINRH